MGGGARVSTPMFLSFDILSTYCPSPDLQDDEDFGRDFQDDEALEDLEDEEEEEEGEGASPDFKQLVKSKEKKKPAAAAKATAKVV